MSTPEEWLTPRYIEIELRKPRLHEFTAKHRGDDKRVIARFWSWNGRDTSTWDQDYKELNSKLQKDNVSSVVLLFDHKRDAALTVWQYRGVSLREQYVELLHTYHHPIMPGVSGWLSAYRRQQIHLSCVQKLIDRVAGALEILHSAGITNCMLTPDNIWFTEDDNNGGPGVMLTSLAIGKSSSADYERIDLCYMPPELYYSDLGRVGFATDVYSLAIIACEMIAKHPAFEAREGTNTSAILSDILNKEPSFWGIPRPLQRVLRKALAKNVGDRHQTMAEFRADFNAACKKLLPPIAHRTPRGSLPRPVDLGRRRFVTGLAAVVAMLAIGGVVAHGVIVPDKHGGKSPVIAGSPTVRSMKGKPAIPGVGSLVASFTHDDKVTVVVPSPDGSMLASADWGGRIVVRNSRNVQSYLLDDSYQHNWLPITGLAWAEDNQHLVTGGKDGFMNLWNLTTQQVIASKNLHGNSFALVWAHKSGSHLITSVNNTMYVYDDLINNNGFGQPDPSFRAHEGMIYALAVSPDGNFVVTGSEDHTAQILHVDPAQLFFTYRGHTREVLAAAYSPNGKYIATGGADRQVQVWNAINDIGSVFRSYPHKTTVRSVVFSPDSKIVASGSDDGIIYLYSVETGELLYTYAEHSAPVTSIAWLGNDGKLIVTAAGNEVHIWRSVVSY